MTRRLFFVAVPLLALAAGCDPMEVHGSLHSQGGTLGTWSFYPGECWNGDTREFYGVDLDDGRMSVRIAQDPIAGYTVGVALKGDADHPDVLLTDSSGCRVLDEHFDREDNSSKNDTDEDDSLMNGDVDIECPTPGGGTLTGHVDFEDCPNPGVENP
jgi:hypothetical protein